MSTLPKPEVFDVSSLEEEVSALIDKRGPASRSSALRRLHDESDIYSPKSRAEDSGEVATDAGTQDASDAVNHPRHYTVHPSGVECITVTRWMNFNLGNVVKYVWRSGEKGATIEDLKKARWYLDDEIGRLEGLTK